MLNKFHKQTMEKLFTFNVVEINKELERNQQLEKQKQQPIKSKLRVRSLRVLPNKNDVNKNLAKVKQDKFRAQSIFGRRKYLQIEQKQPKSNKSALIMPKCHKLPNVFRLKDKSVKKEQKQNNMPNIIITMNSIKSKSPLLPVVHTKVHLNTRSKRFFTHEFKIASIKPSIIQSKKIHQSLEKMNSIPQTNDNSPNGVEISP